MCPLILFFTVGLQSPVRTKLLKHILRTLSFPVLSPAVDWQYSSRRYGSLSVWQIILNLNSTCRLHMFDYMPAATPTTKHGQIADPSFYISASTHFCSSFPVLLGDTPVTCALYGPHGCVEQLVTASFWQMSVSLFTVEAPPPDGFVREVSGNCVRGPRGKLGTSLAALDRLWDVVQVQNGPQLIWIKLNICHHRNKAASKGLIYCTHGRLWFC